MTADQRGTELEQAILADPEDRDACSVYADWLLGNGDPRGELIALALAGDDRAFRGLLDAHAERLLGRLAAHRYTHDGTHRDAFTWRHGFIHGVRLSRDHHASADVGGRLPDILDQVLRHPLGRLLAEVTIVLNDDPIEDDLQRVVDVLAAGAPVTLRRLCFEPGIHGAGDNWWHHVAGLGDLYRAVPNLRTLVVRGGELSLGQIDLPNLVHAELRTSGMTRFTAGALARAHWPMLERLDVLTGYTSRGHDCTLTDFRALLARADLVALRRLGVRHVRFPDELCDLIMTSPLLPQLEVLDLSGSCLRDYGAATLLDHRDALAHLRILDVSGNYLSSAAVAALQRLPCAVLTTRQDDDPELVPAGGD